MYQFTKLDSVVAKVKEAAAGVAVMAEFPQITEDVNRALQKWGGKQEYLVAMWQQGAEGGSRGYIGRQQQKINQTCFTAIIQPTGYGYSMRFMFYEPRRK